MSEWAVVTYTRTGKWQRKEREHQSNSGWGGWARAGTKEKKITLGVNGDPLNLIQC